jgi:hypothetical protein
MRPGIVCVWAVKLNKSTKVEPRRSLMARSVTPARASDKGLFGAGTADRRTMPRVRFARGQPAPPSGLCSAAEPPAAARASLQRASRRVPPPERLAELPRLAAAQLACSEPRRCSALVLAARSPRRRELPRHCHAVANVLTGFV